VGWAKPIPLGNLSGAFSVKRDMKGDKKRGRSDLPFKVVTLMGPLFRIEEIAGEKKKSRGASKTKGKVLAHFVPVSLAGRGGEGKDEEEKGKKSVKKHVKGGGPYSLGEARFFKEKMSVLPPLSSGKKRVKRTPGEEYLEHMVKNFERKKKSISQIEKHFPW